MPEPIATTKVRSAYWDNVKFFLIALVVLGHSLYAFQNRIPVRALVSAIYFFHMPAFVFVSGFFSKSENSRRAKSLWKLIFAYLFLWAFYLGWAVLTSRQLKLTVPYYSSWYLLALVFWRLVTPYCSKIRFGLVYFTVVAILVGFWSDVRNGFALARIIALYPFFLAGYYLPSERVEKLTSRPLWTKILLGGGGYCAPPSSPISPR